MTQKDQNIQKLNSKLQNIVKTNTNGKQLTRIPQNPAKVKPKLHEKSTQGGQNSTKVNKHRLKCDMNGKTLKTRKIDQKTTVMLALKSYFVPKWKKSIFCFSKILAV